MKRKEIYYKDELGIESFYQIQINEKSSISEYFSLDKIIAGQRILKLTGNKEKYLILVNEIERIGYTNKLPENVRFEDEIGMVKEMYNNWYTQKYLQAFDQTVIIGIPNKDKSNHIIGWLKTLEEKSNCIRKIVSEKIKKDYKSCYNGVKDLWEPDHLRDAFPVISNDDDALNLLTDITIGIYDERTYNHETMDKHIYDIRASCPWDIEHGIEFEIKHDELKSCD